MTASSNTPSTVAFCRSRRGGRRCTRPLGHPGLHEHRAVMWHDLGADPPRCSGSGLAATPAAVLADGFPDGRAVCPACQAFVPLAGDRLAEHDAGVDGVDDARRAEWFNTHGW